MEPQKKVTPKKRLQESQGLKSLITILAVVLVYFVGSYGLEGYSPDRLLNAQAWSNMKDLVMRLGPYHRINNCRLATQAWGPENPYSGTSDPAKVAAVCEQRQTLYLYDKTLLDKQVKYAKEVWNPLMDTFKMALIGAGVGAVFAIPASLLAAQNLVRFKPVYYLVRGILNLIRTIPDLVLAAVFVGSMGLGALPGITAMAIFSFALVAKLLSESIEAIDPGPLEAIRAAGGNSLQTIGYAVVPQVLPQYLAYSLYVLEICVRASTVLGLVGAGGIGYLFYANLNLTKYNEVGAIIVVMLAAVVLIDFISTKLRERLV